MPEDQPPLIDRRDYRNVRVNLPQRWASIDLPLAVYSTVCQRFCAKLASASADVPRILRWFAQNSGSVLKYCRLGQLITAIQSYARPQSQFCIQANFALAALSLTACIDPAVGSNPGKCAARFLGSLKGMLVRNRLS